MVRVGAVDGSTLLERKVVTVESLDRAKFVVENIFETDAVRR